MKHLFAISATMLMTLTAMGQTPVITFDKTTHDFGKINEVYGSYFTEGVYPARSCVEVARLPKDAKVEIECMALDTLAYERQMQQHQCGGCHSDCEDGCCGGCE